MNIVDAIIILLFISGAVIGFKRGFTKQLVSFIGFFLVVIFAFLLKNPVSIFLYENLPFFKFAGVIKGVTVLNIALYEIIAFLVLFSILSLVFKIVLQITNIFEGLLKITVVLAPISKIGGAIVGFIEAYVWIFIILYIANMPVFNIVELDNSKYKDKILDNTPVLSSSVDEYVKVIEEFTALKEKYETTTDAGQFNKETLDLFLKYNVTTVESIETLVKKDKLKIDNIDEVLNKYREA